MNNVCPCVQSQAMKERSAAALLLLTSLIWGFSFVAQSVSSELVGPFTFNSIRFLIGAAVLVPFCTRTLRKESRRPGWLKKTVLGGMACGLMLALASVAQQAGIATSGAGKGGFITSIYVVIVPFLSLITGSKVEGKTWIAAIAALAGMYLLCMGGESGISSGDLLLIVCAVFFSLHIMVIDHFSKDTDGIVLSMFQFLTAGIITLPGMLIEGPSVSVLLSAWLPIVYAGALSCGVAYTLQVVGQKYVRPSHAVLILSLESVWAAIGGALMLGERMSARELTGCVLVFLAVIAAQIELPGRRACQR